ncbi:hypothetical protein HanRHA438_Chr13g0578811 [Helianthus annuus]|nr:hypothetical protein HanRHA438_Chr13g0578811 [Helianthus annuus]
MPFSSLRFGYFCDFRPKVWFSTSGSKRFKILPFSSDTLTSSIFLTFSQRYCHLFRHFFGVWVGRKSTDVDLYFLVFFILIKNV